MKNHQDFRQDDDNSDAMLFRELEQYVLRNCPNPERVGCPPRSVLAAFVENPMSIALRELNDLHIMKCAECTRDLIELRKEHSDKASL